MLTPELEDTRKTEESFGPTVSVGNNWTLLQSSMQPQKVKGSGIRVLIVEDNSILRNLLIRWLTAKRYEHAFAVNGRDGVRVFETEGPFDVVLLDMSMPLLDGVGATFEIRAIEANRAKESAEKTPERVRILALTGMSSREDKGRAFKAGVDGYLVKPVAFKALDDMFHKMGLL
jgi:CheY-like chemotaxis protein